MAFRAKRARNLVGDLNMRYHIGPKCVDGGAPEYPQKPRLADAEQSRMGAAGAVDARSDDLDSFSAECCSERYTKGYDEEPWEASP